MEREIMVSQRELTPVVAWHERHVPLAPVLVFGFIRKYTELAKDSRYHGILRKCVSVGEVFWQSLYNQCFQSCLVHCITGTTGDKNIIHIALIRKPAAHEQRSLNCLSAVRQENATISGCSDFLTFQVFAQVFHEQVQIVTANVEEIVFLIVVIIHIAPHTSDFLPYVIVFLGALVDNVHGP